MSCGVRDGKHGGGDRVDKFVVTELVIGSVVTRVWLVVFVGSLASSPDLLAICHKANALFTAREDEVLIAWTSSIAAKAQQSLIMLEPASLEWTEESALEYKSLDTNLNSSLPLEHLLRLRFSFLAIINLLLHRCIYIADTSATGSNDWSVGAMLRRWNHLIFTDTKARLEGASAGYECPLVLCDPGVDTARCCLHMYVRVCVLTSSAGPRHPEGNRPLVGARKHECHSPLGQQVLLRNGNEELSVSRLPYMVNPKTPSTPPLIDVLCVQAGAAKPAN